MPVKHDTIDHVNNEDNNVYSDTVEGITTDALRLCNEAKTQNVKQDDEGICYRLSKSGSPLYCRYNGTKVCLSCSVKFDAFYNQFQEMPII